MNKVKGKKWQTPYGKIGLRREIMSVWHDRYHWFMSTVFPDEGPWTPKVTVLERVEADGSQKAVRQGKRLYVHQCAFIFNIERVSFLLPLLPERSIGVGVLPNLPWYVGGLSVVWTNQLLLLCLDYLISSEAPIGQFWGKKEVNFPLNTWKFGLHHTIQILGPDSFPLTLCAFWLQ